MELLERGEHRLDVAGPPRRWPVRLAQVLDDENRALAVVLPREHARQERLLDLRVDPVLATQEAGRRFVDSHFGEPAAAVGELDEPALHERVAAARRPRERPNAEALG